MDGRAQTVPAVREQVLNVGRRAGLSLLRVGARGACLLPPSGAQLLSLLFEKECGV